MDEEQENKVYKQDQKYRRKTRKQKKEQKKRIGEMIKRKAERKAGKIAGSVIKKWLYGLMLSVVCFVPAVIVFDIYAFITLFTKKLGKTKIWDWGILIFANSILAVVLIIFSMIIYCAVDPVGCGLEVAKGTVDAVVEGAKKAIGL